MWGFARVAPGAEVDFSTQETNLSHPEKGLEFSTKFGPRWDAVVDFFVKHIPAETALLYLHTGKGAVICNQVPWRQNTISRYWYTQNTPEVINVLSEMISLQLHTIVELSDIASNNDRVEKTAEMSAFQFNFLWIKCSGLQNVETSLLAFTPVQRLILPVLQSALCEVIHLYRVCCMSIKPAVRLSKLELMKSF